MEAEARWERIERTIEYLVAAAANHDSQIGEIRDLHKEQAQTVYRLESAFEKMIDSQKQLLKAQVVFVEETRRGMAELQNGMSELKEQMAHTDESLGALIRTVDEIIRRDGRVQ